MYEFTGAFQDPFYMGYRLVGSIHMANLQFSFLRAFLQFWVIFSLFCVKAVVILRLMFRVIKEVLELILPL
jgi:hypothetical protein